MPTCETCGNDYDKAFQVTMNGQAHTFDSFECAIHALARRASIAERALLDTALKRTARIIAVTTAPRKKV